MDFKNKATKINLFNFSTIQMRTFHMTWFAFFLCFFGWFGIAPLMAVVREDLQLTKAQVGNTIIASVAITVLARLFIGWLCDKIGPRRSYTWLLALGAIPVMSIGLADSYETFLLFRLAIGAIGASFVITQYHTSVMFAPNVVGTANATTAGWGNLGGGVTQMVMPLVLAGVMTFAATEAVGWRIAMIFPGIALLVMAYLYWKYTEDSPDGSYDALRAQGDMEGSDKVSGQFWKACADFRVWALFVMYGACFGIELTLNNIAALYFHDYFELGLATAGLVASLFGLMNIFARTLGGVVGDRWGAKWGLKGRVWFLGVILFFEGLALMLFSQQTVLPIAIATLILFSLCVQMSEGATFSVVPFINKKALGAVSGIVGAGGNAGAVAAGFLFKTESLTWPQALLILGAVVTCCSFLVFAVRFSEADQKRVEKELSERLRLAESPAQA
ncbi:MAG: MFS transporter [Bryobacterales bacterium]|nr:MFS transporter [Bryobacterales bacterium]